MVDTDALFNVIESVCLAMALPVMAFLIGAQVGMLIQKVISEMKGERGENETPH